MALARRAGGDVAAGATGLFMAISPRFLTAFSLNNVGQYPDFCALGTSALALLAAGSGLMTPLFLAGLAVWQQLVAICFLATLGIAVAATPALRSPRSLAAGALGFAAGSYPLWIWNAAHGWATFDFFRRGGRDPAARVTGLPESLSRTAGVSLPKMFGLTDAGLPPAIGTVVSLLLLGLVLWRVGTGFILGEYAGAPMLLSAATLSVALLCAGHLIANLFFPTLRNRFRAALARRVRSNAGNDSPNTPRLPARSHSRRVKPSHRRDPSS